MELQFLLILGVRNSNSKELLKFLLTVQKINEKFLANKLIEPVRNFPYTKFEKCDPPLGTMNGIGFRLYCGGRYDYDTNSQAWYLFFCFIIPLFPIGCYRATEVSSSGKGSSYRIYGHDKWRFWEVILMNNFYNYSCQFI